MSSYIQISGWSGGDVEEATQTISRVFRLTKVEADSAMVQISQGMAWYFERPISDDQSGKAEAFLVSKGFDVELLPELPLEEPSADYADDLPMGFDGVEDFPETPARETLAKPSSDSKPKRQTSKAGVVFILLLLIAVGLSQTQFGKEMIKDIVSQAKDLMKNFETKPDAIKAPPVPQTPRPKEMPQPAQTPQPAVAETQNAQPTVKPLEGIAFEGEASAQYPVTLRGCRADQDQLNFVLLRADFEQTQSGFFCKGKTVANPEAEWNCDFKPDEKMCPGKEAYSCARMYQCIPETPEFNKAKFGKEIEDLDDLENQINTGLTNLTLFRGVAIDPKNIDQTTSSVSGCYSGYVLKENLLVSDLNKTQESSVCKDGTIANPFGGWKCELGQTECVDPDDKFYTCNRSFQCVKETPDYNRAKFKQELEELPSTSLNY